MRSKYFLAADTSYLVFEWYIDDSLIYSGTPNI